jgi:hypothetical protein
MDVRRQWVFGLFLVVAGAALWIFVIRDALPPSERAWRAQIALDAPQLTQLLRYDFQLENARPVEEAWAKRKALYDDEHLAELREKLTAFVDFEVAEYADAKEIYLSGKRPERPSQGALAAQERLRAAFPAEAEEMIAQFRDRVREVAYRSSPVVAGADPAAPRLDERHDLVMKWLPEARARVAELTTR